MPSADKKPRSCAKATIKQALQIIKSNADIVKEERYIDRSPHGKKADQVIFAVHLQNIRGSAFVYQLLQLKLLEQPAFETVCLELQQNGTHQVILITANPALIKLVRPIDH